MSKPIDKIDPNFASKSADEGFSWYDAEAVGLEGRAWDKAQMPDAYCRLPGRCHGVVREPVWTLSHTSAGLAVRFVTDATSIGVRWTLKNSAIEMMHMPASGRSGIDLYANVDGRWMWAGAAQPDPANPEDLWDRTIAADMLPGKREYIMYLPLYNGVNSVQIGLSPEATMERAPEWPGGEKPIVFYGTSITQGGCASRPGMAYPAILGRKLGYETINLGFSGNAHSEPEVADLLAELDPAAYVLDPLPNMKLELIAANYGPLIRKLRAARPDTPIVLVEELTRQRSVFSPTTLAKIREMQALAAKVRKELIEDEKLPGLTVVPAEGLLGDDNNGTVDGTHPTDLGFLRMADHMLPYIEKALASA